MAGGLLRPDAEKGPQQTLVSPGPNYIPQGAFNLFSGIVNVPAGAGIVTGVPIVQAINRPIPSGMRILLQTVSLQVVAGPLDQILFDVAVLNVLPEFSQLNASVMATLGVIPINEVYEVGPVFINCYNISGTSYAGASGSAVTCSIVAAIVGILLGDTDRQKLHYPAGLGAGYQKGR